MPARPNHAQPELMAPAGDPASLRAALQAGADAVYFGLRGMNMRANYKNFTPSQLPRIAAACHEAGARAYLALNTIVYEPELRKAGRILQAARDAGIDRVICWDLAVVEAATRLGLPVALSTQASVSNTQALAAYHRAFGIQRFVLARECTLAHLKAIRRGLARELGPEKAAGIELEVFAHGAMCVSLSGRCFLSEERFGKSGNRGECLQPCRREYTLIDDEGHPAYRLGPQYLLSPEDLCTMPFLDQLLAAGVDCLKIEGRARTPEYVETVTSAYREALDFYFKHHGRPGWRAAFEALKQKLTAKLDGAYHRGLSSGFYMGQPIGQWTTGRGSHASRSKTFVGEVLNYYRRAGAMEIQVHGARFALGSELLVEGASTGVLRVPVGSIQIEHTAQPSAEPGQRVAVGVPGRVRPRDKVYLVTRRGPGKN